MTDADALLATIRADPDDDVARLVYADWQEEHGNLPRAQFIRAQLERARLVPSDVRHTELLIQETQLLSRHAPEWTAPLRKALGSPKPRATMRQAVEAMLGRREITSLSWHVKHGIGFERGFVERLSLTTVALNTYGAALMQLAPVREVILDVHEPFTELPIGTAPLAGVRRLMVVGPDLEQPLAHLQRSPHLAALRSLCLAGRFPLDSPNFVTDGVFPWASLDELEMFGGQHAGGSRWLPSRYFDHAALERLLSFPFDHLTTLSLNRVGLGDAVAPMLTRRPWPTLTTLRLPQTYIRNLTPLADSPVFPALATLDLEGNYIDDANAVALANAPHLPNLAHVYFRGNRITRVGEAALRERFGTGLRL